PGSPPWAMTGLFRRLHVSSPPMRNSSVLREDQMKQISRRTILGTAAAMAATPALAEGCQVGPPQHHKGPLVFMNYDQLELDASYDQLYYEPLIAQVGDRLSSNSDATRARLGAPRREAYGPTEIEKLDIYRTNRPNAPIFVFIHGGNLKMLPSRDHGTSSTAA